MSELEAIRQKPVMEQLSQPSSSQGSAHTGRQWFNRPVPFKIRPQPSKIRPVQFLHVLLIHLEYTLI